MTNTPPDVRFNPGLRLLTWHPRGVLDTDAVSKIVAFLEHAEESAQEPFNRFVDLSWLMGIDLDLDDVVRVSMHRRHAFKGNEPAKAAFLVYTTETTHYAKVHQILNQYTPLEVKVFTELSAAAAWLGVPTEALLG